MDEGPDIDVTESPKSRPKETDSIVNMKESFYSMESNEFQRIDEDDLPLVKPPTPAIANSVLQIKQTESSNKEPKMNEDGRRIFYI